MEYVVVSFRSRAHTVRFYNRLIGRGIRCEIISTPKEAGVGCGLSVKTPTEAFAVVKRITRSMDLNSFAGFFLVKIYAGRKTVKSI